VNSGYQSYLDLKRTEPEFLKSDWRQKDAKRFLKSGRFERIFRMSKMIQGIAVLETVTAILVNQGEIPRDEPAKPPLSAGTSNGS
jgi:hypothetical protein